MKKLNLIKINLPDSKNTIYLYRSGDKLWVRRQEFFYEFSFDEIVNLEDVKGNSDLFKMIDEEIKNNINQK